MTTISREQALEGAKLVAQELEAELGAELVMAAAYGSVVAGEFDPARSDVNVLLCLERCEAAVLSRVAPALQRARTLQRVAPFVLSRAELTRSADVFAAKFEGMRRSYALLAGRDLLAELRLEPRDVRLACEREVRNLTLKLRRAYLLEQPRSASVLAALRLFLPQLMAVLRLVGPAPAPGETLVNAAARVMGFEAAALEEALALRADTPPPWPLFEPKLGALLLVLERVGAYVDALPGE